IPGLLPLGAVQRVLQGLLDEQVSIRDLGRVLEGVGQRARATTDADALLEAARASLGPALTMPYQQDGVLHVITLHPAVEQAVATKWWLEGDDLEALLITAQSKGGPNARIVRADKYRHGGLWGFFAKERFEVAVEIPEPGPAPAPAPALPAGSSPAAPPGRAV